MNDDTFYPTVGLHKIKTPRLRTVYRHSGRDWQDAESIVFVHGSLGSGRWWEVAMAAFEELMPGTYACYAPDLRSHGDAEALPVQGIKSFVQDTLSVLDSIGLKQAHFVGWSMGGAVAMQMALDYPQRCLSLTLVNSITPYGTATYPAPANRNLLADAIRRGDFEVVAKAVRMGNFKEGRFPVDNSPPGNALLYYLIQSAMQARNYPGDEAADEGNPRAMQNFDVSKRCGELNKPLLLIHGDKDGLLTSAEHFANMRQAWSSQWFKEVIFEGSGHAPMVEQPRRFAVTLDSFFSSL